MRYYNYDVEILDALLEKGVIDEDLYEKCQPKYISSLPGDLRSTDSDVLQSRLDAIDERLDELEDDMKEDLFFIEKEEKAIEKTKEDVEKIQKALDEYNKKLEDWTDTDGKSQGEAIDESNDIIKRWDYLVDATRRAMGAEINGEPVMPKVNGIYNLNTLMRMFGDEFEFKGYLTGEEAQFIRTIADSVGAYAFSGSNGGRGTQWSTEMALLADDIHDFADKYDINKNDVGDDLVDLMGVTSTRTPSEWERLIDYSNNTMLPRHESNLKDLQNNYAQHEKEYSDLSDNRKKTENRLNEVSE